MGRKGFEPLRHMSSYFEYDAFTNFAINPDTMRVQVCFCRCSITVKTFIILIF